MKPLTFKIIAQDKKSRARAGIISTPNGKIETPYLIPVATRARIEALDSKDLKKLKIQALLANTYHLHFQPGEKKIKKKGGLRGYMQFNKPFFTDSGGFQAMSLGDTMADGFTKLGKNHERVRERKESFIKITNKGVFFKSIYDHKWSFLDAKKSMQIQSDLGSNVIMSFDECTAANKSHDYQKEALERTKRWGIQSLKYHDKKQALYGIIQGGQFKDLRLESTEFVSNLPFDGIAIGGSFGESYGDSKKAMHQILEWIMHELEKNQESYSKPRHMLGIGWIDDLFECVERGIDTFDCVEMTRVARHGNVFISPRAGGSLKNKFRNSIRESDATNKPIDPTCSCSTCKKYTKAELYKLKLKYKEGSKEFGRLATIHNIHFMLNLCAQIRKAIKQGKFSQLKRKWIR
jgi:queuine tRNA-ribosyltransferase